MRKIIYLVHTSVDGFIEGPAGEFDWPVMGPELSADVRRHLAGLPVAGSVTFALFTSAPLWVERAPETHRGLDARVFRGVDPRRDHDGRSA